MKELTMGQKVEREHASTISYLEQYFKAHKKLPARSKIFKHIAIDHLKEDPKYYTKLKMAKL